LRRELHGLRDSRVLRDVHVEQLVRADAKDVEELVVDFAFGEGRNHEVEARAPAQHAEDERADEAGLVGEERRGKGLLALDAAEEVERALPLGHGMTRHRSARATSAAFTADFPGRCKRRTRSAPSPHATMTPSSIAISL